jgi:hypothetical protein
MRVSSCEHHEKQVQGHQAQKPSRLDEGEVASRIERNMMKSGVKELIFCCVSTAGAIHCFTPAMGL